jgi:hypothetical protein
MSREDDKKIAEWLGWEEDISQGIAGCPHYTTSDADAITLLPVLVERGYDWSLRTIGYAPPNTECCIYKDDIEIVILQPTISKAITSAILELMVKEERG